jgi:hypothetical protein
MSTDLRTRVGVTSYQDYRDREGNTHRVVSINDPKIIEDRQIQKMGRELLGYMGLVCKEVYREGFPALETVPDSNAPEYANPNAFYCISFAGVDFLSSAGLGKLISMDKEITKDEKTGRRRPEKALALVNVKPEIFEVFEMTKLTNHFNMCHATLSCYFAEHGIAPDQ